MGWPQMYYGELTFFQKCPLGGRIMATISLSLTRSSMPLIVSGHDCVLLVKRGVAYNMGKSCLPDRRPENSSGMKKSRFHTWLPLSLLPWFVSRFTALKNLCAFRSLARSIDLTARKIAGSTSFPVQTPLSRRMEREKSRQAVLWLVQSPDKPFLT